MVRRPLFAHPVASYEMPTAYCFAAGATTSLPVNQRDIVQHGVGKNRFGRAFSSARAVSRLETFMPPNFVFHL